MLGLDTAKKKKLTVQPENFEMRLYDEYCDFIFSVATTE